MSYPELDLAILKTLITNKKCAIDFINEGDAKLFSTDVWNFASVLIQYIKAYKDIPTLRVLLDKQAKNGLRIEYVTEIWQTLEKFKYDDREYKHDLSKLKQRYAEQELSRLTDKLNKVKESGEIFDVQKCLGDIQRATSNIKNLEHGDKFENKNIKDYLPIFTDNFNYRKSHPAEDSGLMTGYSFLDYATNGFRNADFCVIAGESGFGKSLLLNNIAIQTWLQKNQIIDSENFSSGKNIIYFSLEMPYEDCFNRVLSRLSGVPSRRIENAKLSKEEFVRIKQVLEFINKYPYQFKIVDIANARANDIEAILLETGEKFDAVFIDYLGIMETNEKSEDQDWLKQGRVSYEIRAIGRKYNLPLFSAVQLNRKNSKESSDNIGLSRLARSATIATHCTHVLQIESRAMEENRPDFLYHMVKNRKGPKGKGILMKNLACAALLDKPMESSDNMDNSGFVNYDDMTDDLENLELEL